MDTKAARLLRLARDLAASIPDFQNIKGAGEGDHATLRFMRDLRKHAVVEFGQDHSERAIAGANASKVDFYFENEATVVEVALGLPNPNTEFEKDILKALMAQDAGHKVERLFFISRAGAAKKCAQPARAGFIKWAATKHGLKIEVHELGGEPRKYVRARKPQAKP
jgi:hypothetical protein